MKKPISIRGYSARTWAVRFALGLTAISVSSTAFAQTCPACYQNAAAQAPGMLQALRTGVLVMMFPSLLMFILIFGVVFRRRNNFICDSDEGTGSYPDRAKGGAPGVAAAPFKA